MKQRISRFMMGRYGNDELNTFLFVIEVILFVLSLSFRTMFGFMCSTAALVLIFIALFRSFSRNKMQRYRELSAYLRLKRKVTSVFGRFKMRFNQRKTHRFYKCPGCGTTVRVPKGKGKIKITCPKCHMGFIKKS